LDGDLKGQYAQYNSLKTSLASVQRKQTGNLSQKSLSDIVSKDDFIWDSEYLQTVLVAVPK
jgi:V-type H+-transporting ATPase subunit C